MLYSLIEAIERQHKNIRPIEVVSSQPVHLLSHCLISTYLPDITNIAVVLSNSSGAICLEVINIVGVTGRATRARRRYPFAEPNY